jgi:outer membrane protein TolC
LEVEQASFQVAPAPSCHGTPTETKGPAFPEASELAVDSLVEQVLARNPTLPQMIAAQEAASDRFPQVTSLDDPAFGTTVAPASIGSREVDFGYSLELTQKYPFPGKLKLRGENALAEASAAGNEVDDTRLQLIEAAKTAFYDYYFVYRALAVNERGLSLLATIRENTTVRYTAGLADQQEVVQLDVEIGRQHERRVILDRLRQVAIARLNTLMHLPPDLPLPPPPKEVTLGAALPDAAALRATAIAGRPDLAAVRNRIAAEEASLGLAYREFYPDFDVMAAYNTIMGNGPMHDLAPQVAVRINLPVRTERRFGAVSEAQARIAQRRAELARLTDQAQYEVEQAYRQVQESEQVVRLYEKEVLPAAERNVKAAQAAYPPAKIPLIALIEAQRNVVNLQDRYYEAVADYFRRLATLERATGGSLTPLAPPGSTPAPSGSPCPR